ncbi:TPA: hypothetical protein ACHKEV_003864 [Escherichia coli]|uniref:hypothetical protein n=1 Tax=Escherichia coli TaxID=562 RepID=UPI00092DE977|nr:hypothetical protein [Escherichia coli]APJ68204.1 hypothetical protein RG26_18645 [Escherichia coli]APL87472.1 hypothetical protein RG29_24090 [Escherichia coli]EEV6997452.1 hypothetical protein [Escherichia coli]EJV4978772.1 hypothetical protein [Escherichia coli]SQL84913.1 Uncharacterised protein [Escherichia coli]
MKDEIQKLVEQVQILEQAAADKMPGAEKAALHKRAAEIKMEIIKLLPKQGQQPESKVPGLDYFDNKLDPAFGDYFSGDYLTDDMRDYFTVKVPDNMPEARQSTETPKSYEMDADVRKRILNAIGIPC